MLECILKLSIFALSFNKHIFCFHYKILHLFLCVSLELILVVIVLLTTFCGLNFILALQVITSLPLAYICFHQCDFYFYMFSCYKLVHFLFKVKKFSSIAYKVSLMVMNCFIFCLSGKLFIFSSLLNYNITRQGILPYNIVFSFST